MDFPQQLEACVKQANRALSRFIAPLPFQNTPVVETMQYGALLGGKRLRPFPGLCYWSNARRKSEYFGRTSSSRRVYPRLLINS